MARPPSLFCLSSRGSATATIQVDDLRDFTATALRAAGVPADHARTTADVLTTTDAWGVHTHGVRNLGGYLARLRAGGTRAAAQPRIIADGPAWATLDGDAGLGHVVSVTAMEAALDRAATTGVGMVGVRNSGHFGAAGYYAWMAAQRGFIGVAMANDVPTVAAPGGRGAALGSNPLAYAVPAGRHRPIIFDISTAAVAGGKVYAAQARGEPIPNTWLLDAQGIPTTDPSRFPDEGALQPAAGHKGYGLALLVEALSGALTGAATTWTIGNWMWGDRARPTDHGAAMIAIDAATMAPDGQFVMRMEALVDELHGAPIAADATRILVPGEREWHNHDAAQRDGIDLPPDVVTKVLEAATEMGLSVPWAIEGDAERSTNDDRGRS